MKWIASRATSIARGYENFDYDPRYNGERFLLAAVGTVAEKPVIFDVGANKGEWSEIALQECPGAHIHAFELVPETAQALRETLAGTSVHVNAFGLADEEGFKLTRIMADDTRSTLIEGAEIAVAEITAKECQIQRGDNYLTANRISRVDLLKIDTEGAEHLVLAGFADSLAAGRIGAIQFEYGQVHATLRFLLADFYDLLTPHGFQLGKLYPNYVGFKPYSVSDENFLGPNYVAVHRDWAALINRLAP